jgi:hypothetical protein
MSWELDTPQVPFEKSLQLARLEQLEFHVREAMDRQEINERIEEAAYGLALAYHKDKKHDYTTCVAMIQQALSETGAALGGKFGAIMVGTSQKIAEKISKIEYNKEEL